MDNYKPNSHKYKEAQKTAPDDKKKVDKVVSGGVVSKKKPLTRKLSDTFLAEDIESVKSYVIFDVAIPAAKKFITDIICTAVEALFGEERSSKRSSSGTSRVSYNKYYENSRGERHQTNNSRNRSNYSYDDIILESRGEAEDVLDHLFELVENYGMASVADLYDLVGVQGNYTDNKYGWTNLSNAMVSRVREGYLLKLPKAQPLD